MKRGEIYDARLEPIEGSEQGGTRPVIVVSRDAINAYSPVTIRLNQALLIALDLPSQA